jgi:membrane protein
MAYNFFLAFFPTIILLVAILPYMPVVNLEAKIIQALALVVPPGVMGLVQQLIHDTFQSSSFGIISATVVSILFFSFRGARAMIQAFEKADPEASAHRTLPQELLLSLLLYSGLLIFTIIGIALYAGLEWMNNRFLLEAGWLGPADYYLLILFRILFSLSILILGISFIYYIAASAEHRSRFINPGSIIAGVLMFVAESLLSYYFSNFANYNKVFGSLTTVMVLLVWFYWISVVLLLGFELNVSTKRARRNIARQRTGEQPAVVE